MNPVKKKQIIDPDLRGRGGVLLLKSGTLPMLVVVLSKSRGAVCVVLLGNLAQELHARGGPSPYTITIRKQQPEQWVAAPPTGRDGSSRQGGNGGRG